MAKTCGVKIEKCRLCGSQGLTEQFSLGDHKVNTFPDTPDADVPTCPITIVKCDSCGLVQQLWSAPNDLLYSKKYWYKSGVNKTIKEDLRELAFKIAMSGARSVIDIGANDGTLLSFLPKYVKRIAVEPATNLHADLKKNCDVLFDGFWEDYDGETADVITAIGMFYDSEDPVKFLLNAKRHLSRGGQFVAQLMTAKQMYEMSDVGNLCHEHLEFYTIDTLKRLFSDAGFRITSIEENGINGGSYRIYASHANGQAHVTPAEISMDWERFASSINEIKNTLLEFLKDKQNVYVYGASTKANTILQYCGIGPELIKGAIDKDPEKHGKYLLTGIPIVDESHITSAEYLLCMPFGFVEQFRAQEALRGSTAKWIVVSPQFKVL